MSDTKTGTAIKHVGRVMVPVSDQDRAIAFYTDKFGFEKRADIPYGEGDRWVEVGVPGAETTIALVPPREGDPVGVMTNIALDTDDAKAAHSSLREAGVEVDDEMMGGEGPVPPMFFFRDQDGNTLLLVEQ
jgi:catechol 2,3-dioxygenase-like lactoylglutathione lyase family enzyme